MHCSVQLPPLSRTLFNSLYLSLQSSHSPRNQEPWIFILVCLISSHIVVPVCHHQTKRTTFWSSSAKLKTKGKFAVSTCALGKINSVEYEIRFVKDSAGRCRLFLALVVNKCVWLGCLLSLLDVLYGILSLNYTRALFQTNIADSSGGLFLLLPLLQQSYCRCDNYRRCSCDWLSRSEDTRMSITLYPHRLVVVSIESQSITFLGEWKCYAPPGTFILLFNAPSPRTGRPINFVGCAEYNSITTNDDDETKEEGACKFNK